MIISVSKGQQITIPVNIREMFGLDVGSKVDLQYEKGKIVIKPVGESLEELFKEAEHIKPKHRLTAEQMDQLNEGMFR